MKELRDFFTRFSAGYYGVQCCMDADGVIYFTAFDKTDNRAISAITSKTISVEDAQALLREFNK